MSTKSFENRLRGLDEIRSVACLLVLLGHLNYEMTKYFQQAISWKIFNADKEGVTIFFTLSGFIITYRILNHYQYINNGVWVFIKNRALRILPLYFICLFVVVCLIFLYNSSIFDANKLLYYLLLVPNFLESGLPYLHHYWSLGVEEQFYIIYPIVLLSLLKCTDKIQMYALLLIYLILEVVRIILFMNEDVSRSIVNEFGFPFIVLGCFTAILFGHKKLQLSPFINNAKIQYSAAFILMAALCINLNLQIFIHDLICFLMCIIILGQVLSTEPVLKLNNKLFNYLGKISYSIYVWHPIVIAFSLKFYTVYFKILPAISEMILLYVGIIALTIFVAHLSYKFIESYFYFNRKAIQVIN